MTETKKADDYPVWKQLILGCAERPPSHQIYRAWALFHILIAYPIIVMPAFYQVFIAERLVPGFAALMDVVQVVWLGLHCVLLATILLLAWFTRPGAQASPTTLATLTAISAACDLVATLLFALQVGFLNTAPHFVIFTVIVLTRILYPYRVSAAATLSVVAGLVGVTGVFIFKPELARLVPESHAGMATSRLEIFSTGMILLALILALFIGVNFIVNQRNILQRYLTEQVLNRYLPPKLVYQSLLLPRL